MQQELLLVAPLGPGLVQAEQVRLPVRQLHLQLDLGQFEEPELEFPGLSNSQ